jgi:hypothetical protein
MPWARAPRARSTRQPDHGHQRAVGRRQELHLDQPGHEHRRRARPHGDAGRRRRGAALGAAHAGPAARRRACSTCWRARPTMSDVLLRTNIDKLTLLPSGTPHPQGHRAAGQRRDAQPARRHGHALPRPHHHLRFAAPAADHRVAGAGHAHGADRDRGACRAHAAGRCAAGPVDHRGLPGQADAAEQGAAIRHRRLRLWRLRLRLRLWLRSMGHPRSRRARSP